MALGKRRTHRQTEFWVPAGDLPKGPGHPFYEKLNEVFREADLDRKLETAAAPYYGRRNSRPGLPPGVYLRMILLGFFEAIPSDRGIAWHCHDSLSARAFLGYPITAETPDHSTLSGTRRRLPLEWHEAVFGDVLVILAQRGLLEGDTLGVDASTMDANAAIRGIVRKLTGESYREYLAQLAAKSGIATPTAADLARFDRRRKDKKMSNDDWEHPHDPDAKIGKTKDGRTRMIHKPEHAVDMATGAIVAAEVHPADNGDTTTGPATLAKASDNLERTMNAVPELECADNEVVGDKGYHSDDVLTDLAASGYRSYISEPDRGGRVWTDADGVKPAAKAAAQHALYANRRRVRGARGQRLMRRRGELIERSFAHILDTGGMRRTTLRGNENINKRYQLQTAAFNLSLVMRQLIGRGKPRWWSCGLAAALSALFWSLCFTLVRVWRIFGAGGNGHLPVAPTAVSRGLRMSAIPALIPPPSPCVA